MRKWKQDNHTIDIVFMLALFCAFAAAVLSVLLAGAGAYQSIANNMEEQYDERTCLAYVDAKLRHYDERGMVAVRQFGGSDALALSETVDDTQYTTLIYYADGYVRELYFEEGLQFQPEDGEKIIAVQDLKITRLRDDLLRLTCISADGRQEQLLVYLHSGKGVDRYA